MLINGGLIGPLSSQTTQAPQLALSDGLACFIGSFSGVTTTSISHNLGSTDLVVEFKDSLGNLLIPDNWSIINPNVIEAEFSPAATGDVVIIACIESGLAPIRAGVLILEGLSGIIDLDSPNGSIDISTSGQVINLNAIFTAASGAVLEQKCRDQDILSGLINDAPIDARPATGVVNPDADCVYDLGSELARWANLNACSGTFLERPTVNGSGVLLVGEAAGAGSGVDLLNSLAGIIDLVGTDGTIIVTPSGNDIALRVDPLFIQDKLDLSGIVRLAVSADSPFQSTTSKTLVEALTTTFEVESSGLYRLMWSMQISCSQANRPCQFVVELDNSGDLLMDITTSFNVAAGSLTATGFIHRILGSGLHTVDVDFRFAANGLAAAELTNISLESMKLAGV